MTEKELEIASEDAKKFVRRAVTVTVIAVAVAILVLFVDQGIKRSVLEETAKARSILDEFKKVAYGAQAAGQGGSADVAGVDPGGDVADDPAGRPEDGEDPGDAAGAPGGVEDRAA